jgi:hypothetical protein
MKLKKLNVIRISENKKVIQDLISKGFEEVKEEVKKVIDKKDTKDKAEK